MSQIYRLISFPFRFHFICICLYWYTEKFVFSLFFLLWIKYKKQMERKKTKCLFSIDIFHFCAWLFIKINFSFHISYLQCNGSDCVYFFNINIICLFVFFSRYTNKKILCSTFYADSLCLYSIILFFFVYQRQTS